MTPTTRKADRLRARLSINPDEVSPPTPLEPAAPPDASAPSPPSAVDTAAASTAKTAVAGAPKAVTPPIGPPASRPEERTSTTEPAPRVSALDDPTITPGRKDYRSFYIEDAVFARFRAAIYWLARREDAGEVPENMSVAVEQWMQQTADDLEGRFNDGQPFRMPPPQRRRRRNL